VDGLDVGKIVEMSNCSWVFASKNHEAIKVWRWGGRQIHWKMKGDEGNISIV
jgi:hypothetical protein